MTDILTIYVPSNGLSMAMLGRLLQVRERTRDYNVEAISRAVDEANKGGAFMTRAKAPNFVWLPVQTYEQISGKKWPYR